MSSSNLNKSVVKALEIIELLDAQGAMGITEIANRLTMDKSSVFRALNTLKSKHYVRQDHDTLKYSNSYKLFEMGHNVVRETGLPKMAYRFMRQLSRDVDGAVSLGVRDGVKAVYIDKIESDATVRVSMKIGQSLPLYCTGMGKALLAWMPDKKVCDILRGVQFVKSGPNTLDNLEGLLANLAEIRERGYSIDNEEHIPGLFCIAAPVFDASGDTIAAISVAHVKIMLPDQPSVDSLSMKVMGAADDFTSSLGGRRPNQKNMAAQVLDRR
ncbi:IclR family transcriptional regulator [Deltaproteobacteria bacterium Smac51]|nr:IclR family transcriptional regulator [Deltaproteobacteria bacterium Smac51]